jgi:hypothetical protein
VYELAHLARALMVRADADPGPLRLVQLRREPGKGAVARLQPALDASSRRRRGESGAAIWLSLEERTLARPLAGLLRDQPSSGAWPEALDAQTLGISVQGFGVDAALPALSEACAPAAGGEIWEALETAARRQLGASAHLESVGAETVRYRPGSRCVLRYTLTVEGDATMTIFGKLHAEPLRAVAVDAIMRRLHAEQAAAATVSPPVVPRPLGVVEGAGLALTAAAGEGDGVSGPLLPGIDMLRPRRRSDSAGLAVPAASLAAAAEALARLHSSSVGIRDDLGVVRPGIREAERARERAALLGDFAPALAPRLSAAADGLVASLAGAVCDSPVLSHGGFEPSQLVYSAADRMVVTDFDGLCLADPALDVGSFLAHLRPGTIWRERTETETWFAFAAAGFMRAYADGMVRWGTPRHVVEATLGRVPVYEAAALLRIAARRPQRVNSPRSAELSAMLDEIADCLTVRTRAA